MAVVCAATAAAAAAAAAAADERIWALWKRTSSSTFSRCFLLMRPNFTAIHEQCPENKNGLYPEFVRVHPLKDRIQYFEGVVKIR
ncbi:Uncharacterized protein FWK35_00011767 [Aphis craccivora]|uniref:Uncharacterized protein n=1 Tax=Aphis craccivora TaxID=307492 RepID=A0A6G0ZB58_APHCR|nr:Uncharacterized protein FWK35_00011767 [Aphis craccivora]